MAVLRNAHTGAILATRVERTTTLLDRTIGLLTRSRVHRDEGIWIDGCNAIHTMGMRAYIDVIFLDKRCCVLKTHAAVAPYRLVLMCRRAKSVIELGAGALVEHDLLPGDRLELV